ncbi:MAG TPA: hypothetical protein VHK69_11600, partial [Chitinophagaceae bacterium]|nr:hypothetical protein [Chitinophagaceae bacterium]
MLAFSCSSTRSLPEGEKLYTGARVTLNAPELPAKQRKVFRSQLQGLTAPKPNSRLLGIPFKLNIYNMFAKAKPKSFFGKLRNKFGEPPVLLSSVDLDQNFKSLDAFLDNKGFFKSSVTGDTVSKGKKGHAEYTAEAGPRYTLRNIQFGTDSTAQLVQDIRASTTNTLLKSGDPYDLDVVRGERIRIDAFLKERGYFYFSPDALLAQVDSTAGNHQVDLRLITKAEVPASALAAYRINDVFIYTNYRINAERADTSIENAQLHEGYYVVDRRKRFKPKM